MRKRKKQRKDENKELFPSFMYAIKPKIED